MVLSKKDWEEVKDASEKHLAQAEMSVIMSSMSLNRANEALKEFPEEDDAKTPNSAVL